MRQRDKSDLLLPDLSYKYFLLRYSSSILSFYSPKSTFLAAAPPEDSKNFNKGLLHQSPKTSTFFLARKWPSTSSFLRSVYHPSFSVLLLYSGSSAIPFTEYSFSFLSFLLSAKLLGFGRKDCNSYRSTSPPMSWPARKSRSHRSNKCRDKQNPL